MKLNDRYAFSLSDEIRPGRRLNSLNKINACRNVYLNASCADRFLKSFGIVPAVGYSPKIFDVYFPGDFAEKFMIFLVQPLPLTVR